jgi:YD repeat-containing protein
VSRVTTREREVSGQAGQYVTASFSDGWGRTLATIEEGQIPGTWVVKQATSLNLRGKAQSQWLPYQISSVAMPQFSVLWPSGRPPELDGTNLVVASDTVYDPLGRPIRVLAPPETWAGERRETITQHLPFQGWIFDEEDTHAGSPNAGTPHIATSDGLGRLISVVEAVRLDDQGRSTAATNHWVTKYQYDLNDQLIRITDSQNNVKTVMYDGLKRKTFANDPDQGITTYTYDDASNLIETIDAKGQRITYTYDGVKRIRTEEYHDENSTEFSYHHTPDVTYVYDQPAGPIDQGDGTTLTARNTKGLIAYVVDASGEEHTSYDDRGRVEWSVKRIPDASSALPLAPLASSLVSYTTKYDYDAMDRLIRMRYPDNDEVSYVFSDRNLLQRIVGGPSGHIISSISYRASGQQQHVEYGNGVRSTYTYDPRLRGTDLLSVSQPASANRQLISFHYEFDGVSNLKTIEDRRDPATVATTEKRRNSQTFTYDNLYRLTRVQYNLPAGASANGGEISYRYDRIGNLLAQSSDLHHLEGELHITDVGTMTYGGIAGPTNRVGRKANDPPGPHALSNIQRPASTARSYSATPTVT